MRTISPLRSAAFAVALTASGAVAGCHEDNATGTDVSMDSVSQSDTAAGDVTAVDTIPPGDGSGVDSDVTGTDSTDVADATNPGDIDDTSGGTDIPYTKPDWFPSKDSMADRVSKLPGLTGPARVVFDDLGIPHIYAANTQDLFYVQGYVTASQRLFQMHSLRMAASGRLAELLGPSSLEGDVLLRTLKLRATAEKMAVDMKANHPAEYAYLESFCAGVTLYMDRITSGEIPASEISTEVILLKVPGPWTPADSLTVARLLTWDLGFGGIVDEDEILVGTQTIIDAWKDTPLEGLEEDAYNLTPPQSSASTLPLPGGKPGASPASPVQLAEALARSGASRMPKAMRESIRAAHERLGDLPQHMFRGLEWGSNNWVVSGAHTKSGKPLLANDPHLGLRNPSTFYQVQLDTKEAGGDLDIHGVTFAGVPGVVLGTNGTASWGATVFYSDVTDQYVETFSDDGKSVWFQDKWVPLEIRKEAFSFPKADAPCTEYAKGWLTKDTFTAEASADGKFCTLTFDVEDVPHHGPLVPWTIGTGTDGKRYAHSWKWTGFEPTQEIVAFSKLMWAKNFDEFKAALDNFSVGAQNFIYSDTAGNIGWYPSHALPVRNDWKNNPPFLPLPGSGTAEWTGMLDRSKIPQAYNPAQGYLITANSDPRGYSFDGDLTNDGDDYIGCIWDAGFRFGRIHERLSAKVAEGNLTAEDMMAIQADHTSPLGTRIRDSLVARLKSAKDGFDVRAAALWTADMDAALTLLEAWDLEASDGSSAANGSPEAKSSAAAAVFNVWLTFLVNDVIDEKAGLATIGDRMKSRLLLAMIEAPEKMVTYDPGLKTSRLWDNPTTGNATETQAERYVAALAKTLAWLSDPDLVGVANKGGFGSSSPDDWRWGKLHTLTLKHNLVKSFNIPNPAELPEGYPRHGDPFCVDASHPGMGDRSFTFTSGPAIRHVFDMSTPVTRYGALPGGQSEIASSPHYSDQAALWAKNVAPAQPSSTADVLAKKTSLFDYVP